MAKAWVWLSFDLGIRGDFQGIYEFLDAQKANECGDNLAGFSFEYQTDLVAELTERLAKYFQDDKRSRVYLIFPSDGKYVGRFLFGGRKAPRWSGYAMSEEVLEDNAS